MVILIVGIILILYGFISKKKYSVWVGMAFVLLIMGFQEGVPGDYYTYWDWYRYGVEGGIKGMSVKENEFSYIWLVNTCSKIMSYHWFVLITSIIQCFIMALMIKRNADERYQYFGVLLTFFTINIMLLQMKAMRQGYAVEMMLLAYLFLSERRFFFSALSIIIAYGLHNSIFVALPFYAFILFTLLKDRKLHKSRSNINSKKNISVDQVAFPVTICLILLAVYFIGNFILVDYITPLLVNFEFFEYQKFTDELSSQNAIALWLIIYYIVSTFAVAYYYTQERDKLRRFFAILVIVGNFITIAVFGYGNIQRIVMYFIPFSIVVLPNVAAVIEDKKGKSLALYYVIFTMAVLVYISTKAMLSFDFSNGTGYGSYIFSFLDW